MKSSDISQGIVRWCVLVALIALIVGVALFLTGVVLDRLGLGQEPPCEGWFCDLPTGPAAVMMWTGGFLAIVGGISFPILGGVLAPLVGLEDWPSIRRLLPLGGVLAAVLALLTFAVIAVAEWKASSADVEAMEKKQEEKKAPRMLKGGPGNNVLNGGPSVDTLMGNEGDDILYGGPGNDTLYGGPGDDKITGHAGKDVMYGESGNDTIEKGVVDGQADFIDCGDGEDTVTAQEMDEIVNCENIHIWS